MSRITNDSNKQLTCRVLLSSLYDMANVSFCKYVVYGKYSTIAVARVFTLGNIVVKFVTASTMQQGKYRKVTVTIRTFQCKELVSESFIYKPQLEHILGRCVATI